MTTREVKAEALKKGDRVWCWWLSRDLYYSGIEFDEHGYNIETRDYTPRHVYKFRDESGAEFRLTAEQVSKLEAVA